MKEYKKRIQLENRLLWVGIVLLAVFIVVGGEFWNELGFLHSYQMTDRARQMQSILLFGFLVYFIIRLVMTSSGVPSLYLRPSLMTTIRSLTSKAWLKS